MSRSKENVLEKNIHFVILGITGLIAAVLLFKFVLVSPNSDEFMGQTVTPSNVDSVIKDYSRRIETALNAEPEPRGRYVAKATEFESLMENSISDVALAYFVFPGADSAATESLREYDLPTIPSPREMYADKVRTVAHKPITQLQIEDSYATAPTRIEDIDVVTVQAKVDMTAMYESFERTFAGRSIQPQWRDAGLARITFAGVQLQRQELVAGRWSDWSVVPRARIDKYSKAFEEVYNAADPSIAEMLMPQFFIPELWRNAMQPEMYDIAQLDFKWYPPSLIGDYMREQENLERERQRAEREATRDAAAADRRQPRERRTTTQTAPAGGDMGMGGMGMDMGMGGAAPATQQRQQPRTRDTADTAAATRTRQARDFQREYEAMKIPERADAGSLRGEVVVWAHDDTVEPGKTYRYRLRYGVFNPVAGRGWYAEQYSDYNDEIVLWSEFTPTTSPFHIDMREYIFPTGTRDNSVLVKIAKLKLGNWQTQDFRVSQGEFIGYEVEQEVKRATTTRYNPGAAATQTETELVDYSTGAIFLSLKDVVDWELTGVVGERSYQAMLYSKDGKILSLPTRDRFWPQQLIEAQKTINSSAGRIVEVATDRGAAARSTGGMGGGMGGDGMGMPGMGMPGMW